MADVNHVYTGEEMNRLPYLWVALLLCISACTRTEQTVPEDKASAVRIVIAKDSDQTRDRRPAESPFPPTDPARPPLVTPFDSDQAKALQKAWADHLGTPLQITNSIGVKLNLIPRGEFTMGSPESEENRGADETQHQVKITKPFYLSVHEVTQAQYERMMGDNPSRSKDAAKPVETVSWDDAIEFCHKLSDQEGVEYRLPTEAEWEYACRAGMTTTYSFGDDQSRLGKYAWYNGNRTNPNALLSNDTPHPVGELKPNAWGLFDMHGNVKEWCQDRYGNYEGLGVVGRDPTGPASGDDGRVLRGGAFGSPPKVVRAADRYSLHPDFRHLLIGFRLVRTIPLSP